MSDDEGGIELQPIRARTAECSLVGNEVKDGKSYASVVSKATHLQETDRVIYEIKWDGAVAPAGHGALNASEGQASGWVVDLSQDGKPIGDDKDHYSQEGGVRVFSFNDGIEWNKELRGGSWWFRLRVVNGAGTEVANSGDVKVDWDSPTQ